MKVTVIGAGYVGLVTGACLAEMGNHVVCVDVDEQKIRVLKDGGIPIHEPGLDELVRRNVAGSRLEFSTDLGAAIGHLTILMIAVCPPPDEDGAADLLYVLSAARSVGQRMADYKVVVDKSTVPVGTADTVRHAVTAELARDCGLLWETCAPLRPVGLRTVETTFPHELPPEVRHVVTSPSYRRLCLPAAGPSRMGRSADRACGERAG